MMPFDRTVEQNSGMDLLLHTSFMESNFDQEFNFDFNDYRDNRTPCSSPASSVAPLQSPYSMHIEHSRSPPVTAKDFTEFFEASNSYSGAFETDFSELTLTENEQRELYAAAKSIQKAYRTYRGRKQVEEEEKERTAAIVIQNYYRRYKEYREVNRAASGMQFVCCVSR